MSLINQMLRDLEVRRADSSEKLSLPNEVRPLPVEAPRQRWLRPALMALAGSGISAAIGWAVVEFTTPRPVEIAAAPVAPVRHESTLKLDADLTAARLPALAPVPARVQPQPKAVTESRLQVAVHPKATQLPETGDESKAKIEKRPPAIDNNGSPTQRAREQLNAGQREAAEATLKQALIATPGHVAARQMLFGLMMEARRGDEALALLQEGLAAHPEQAQWAINAARLQVDRSDIAGAWDTLQRSLPAAVSQGEYQAFCGTVLSRLKRNGEAVEHYQAALRTNPSEGRWWVGMALALEADGKPAESRAAFERAQATGKLPPELASYVDSKLKQ